MTFRDLIRILNNLPERAKDCDVSVLDPGTCEFMELLAVNLADINNDVLDEDHPYLILK